MNNINLPPITKNLLIINIIFFGATWLFQSQGIINLDQYLSVFYFGSPFFKPWQPLTYMFMHGSIAHIFFNMFALYSFGTILESRWGGKKFLLFYLITALGALGLQWAVQTYEIYHSVGHLIANVSSYVPTSSAQNELLSGIYFGPMLGASGAIFGLLVAFGMLYPNAELMILFIPVPVKAKYIIPIYILIELSLGIASIKGDSIAHYAHLGGALIGFILVKIWKDKKDNFYTYYE
ncbi:rhomboid family intramembrane serine protease [Pedobacter changchengzhani]|uniref:Rhomboid family intramembrane serine protease n=1 Tax=Pedobacter changchengzhani TaxID=2529274 RepID=A0A4R5MI11_9SPHI|nr:rhomboid family intramembrane serine protease [Pedobacter changchengzhani]TDG35210.1 rhomboid family intramembrane serine protease [Pedobacter changchengzhani]